MLVLPSFKDFILRPGLSRMSTLHSSSRLSVSSAGTTTEAYMMSETPPKQWCTNAFKSMQTKSVSKLFRFFFASQEFPILAHFESKATILNASGYIFRKNGQNPEIPIFSLLCFYHLVGGTYALLNGSSYRFKLSNFHHQQEKTNFDQFLLNNNKATIWRFRIRKWRSWTRHALRTYRSC